MTLTLILLAGGKGSRISSPLPKQYMPLNGKPLVLYSLELFLSISDISEIVVVAEESERIHFKEFKERIIFAQPGKRRQDSVYNGLKMVSKDANMICIHDAARPFIQREEVQELIKVGVQHGSATLAVPLKFTVKEGLDGTITRTPERAHLFEIQTPQIIEKKLLENGFKIAHEKQLTVTDDCSLAELVGSMPKLVIGKPTNIKITTDEDLFLAPYLLQCITTS